MDNKKSRFICRGPASVKSQTIVGSGAAVSLIHRQEDPPDVNRIIASFRDLQVEILPSKGFSIGQVYLNGRPQLWDPPIGICDPGTLNLYSDEIAINGTPAPGFTFLKTFCGGIEFYGLRNWGMPRYDEQKKFLHPLHGETSNIPVDFCDVEINDKEIKLSSSFIYRDMVDNAPGIWYRQGRELYEVVRLVVIGKNRIQLIDRVKNISEETLKPDWGYHITFHPTDGSRLLVASSSVENRSGERVPEDFDRWSPAVNSRVREETGIIHKGLRHIISENGNFCYALVVHSDRPEIKIRFPASPYFQTWFCRGGADSNEFTKVSGGKPLFTRNWDGMGIEIGASALDHNENTDPSVPEPAPLAPGSSLEISLTLDFVDGKVLKELSDEIRKFNENRVFVSN